MQHLAMDALGAKAARLEAVLEDYGRVVVAYSGGVDSALVAEAAHRVLGDDSVAVTAVSASLARRERIHAGDLASRRGWNHRFVDTHELERDSYVRNAPDRCYWCKTELFEVLAPFASELEAVIVVGTNTDDLSDHRPGLGAARRWGVKAPLVEAALCKDDVRALSALWDLPTAAKPASPCLSSRVAYGVPVTPERLSRIDAAEEAVRALGFEVLRVRDHGDFARLEVPASDIERAARHASEISAALHALGFSYVTLDLQGFRSGSLNEVLPAPRLASRDAKAERSDR